MGWSNKVANKLNKQCVSDKAGNLIDLNKGGNDGGKMAMSEIFQNITDVVCTQLNEIIDQNTKRREADIKAGIIQEDDAEDAADYNDDYAKDGFVDFATEDFINKNIRVRPASGATAANEKEEAKSDMFGRNILGSGLDGIDDEEKFNRDMIYEMEQQRRHVKTAKEIADRKLQHELEQIEKLKK